MASSILPLPAAVVAQIRSSIAITSLNDVVLELLKNSIDALAGKVEITVDFSRGGCIIEDDGIGIPPAEFAEGGGLGKLHHTSKHQVLNSTHGTYGRFLASLVALSLVSITSRHHKHNSHNTIGIHNSDVITRQTLSSSQQQRLTLSNHGTRVVVRNLFGSMPVRVKQRGIMDTTAGILKQWDALIKSVTALILAWDRPVSVTLQDAANGQRFRVKGGHSIATWCKGTVESACSILTQASLISPQSRSSWVPVLASTSIARITGVLSTEPAPSKHVQFLSLGVRPLPSSCGYGGLYDEINRLFTTSSFGSEESVRFEDPEKVRGKYTIKELKGMGKGVDRWPQFCLNIEIILDRTVGITEDSQLLNDEHSSVFDSITELLIATVTGFLKQYHFYPKTARKRSTRIENIGPVPKVDSIVREPTGAIFSSWTRTKSGAPPTAHPKGDLCDDLLPERSQTAPPTYRKVGSVLQSISASQHVTPHKILDKSGKVLRRPFEDVDERPQRSSGRLTKPSILPIVSQKSSGVMDDMADNLIDWVDPVTKALHRVNSRTGMILNENKASKRLSTAITHKPHEALVMRKKAKLDDGNASLDEPEWLRNFLRNWRNPIYNPSEKPIPHTGLEPGLGFCSVLNGHDRTCSQLDVENTFHSAGINGMGRLSKTGLKQAEVIAQVDKKYIMAKIPSKSSVGGIDGLRDETNNFLVIIDQHAADERCRIENLMFDFCKAPDDTNLPICTPKSIPGIQTASLENPINFRVSPKERQLLHKHVQHFANWGIMYDLPSVGSIGPRTTDMVVVRALPPGIAERCRMDPKILIELIRSEVWIRDGSGAESRAKKTSKDDIGEIESEKHTWLRKIYDCPKGLLDILNSRSCRSAIMFNDYLTLEQCQTLVSRLAVCAFPFQCAHGRPSMVPLLDMQALRIGASSGPQDLTSKDSFGSRFKKWKETL